MTNNIKISSISFPCEEAKEGIAKMNWDIINLAQIDKFRQTNDIDIRANEVKLTFEFSDISSKQFSIVTKILEKRYE
jgi:hypothetical protein